MATIHQPNNRFPRKLHNGDQMKRSEFHLAYCDMPEGYRAELIGGMVFEPSPVSYVHGSAHINLARLFSVYAEGTPGVGAADNSTVMLSDDDEPQPDLILRINQDKGGQSKITENQFISGAPELVAEIAYSSQAIDLHFKKQRYALHGVIEYVVVCLKPKKIFWFDLVRSELIKSDDKGIFRSIVFPGLWIHGDGLLDLNAKLTDSTLNRGLRSAEHKKFLKV